MSSPGKDCPNCGLYNPPNAMLCDCGFNFNKNELNNTEIINKNLYHKKLSNKVRIVWDGLAILACVMWSLYSFFAIYVGGPFSGREPYWFEEPWFFLFWGYAIIWFVHWIGKLIVGRPIPSDYDSE